VQLEEIQYSAGLMEETNFQDVGQTVTSDMLLECVLALDIPFCVILYALLLGLSFEL
jgi:hypothetical protein